MSLQEAVYSLTRPGSLTLTGPRPSTTTERPIAPIDRYGHDHLWWLDRMVRSSQQLVERMALVLHDWFATSNAGVDRRQQMLDQSNLFRDGCFGSFLDLTINVTKDPAMLQWLNGNENRRQAPNENYARELMELFTLGADRTPTPAYSEFDIREAARALTGWRNDYNSTLGAHNFRFDPDRHDNGTKRIFAGGTGVDSSPWNLHPATNWNWDDVPRICIQHPLHKSFFVLKLWSYFIPTPPSADTQAALESLYTSNNYAIRPVLEAILMHPDFYLGPPMVKPPVVYVAGLLRALGRGIDTEAWVLARRRHGPAPVLAAQRRGLGRQPLARHLPDARPLGRRSPTRSRPSGSTPGASPTTTRPRPPGRRSRSRSRPGTTPRFASSTTTSS